MAEQKEFGSGGSMFANARGQIGWVRADWNFVDGS
jgi:hypothetical protein